MLFDQPIIRALVYRKLVQVLLASQLLMVALVPEVRAQFVELVSNAIERITIIYEHPPVPKGPLPPGRAEGTGTYSPCDLATSDAELTPLIALVPSQVVQGKRREQTLVWGRTTSAHPIFWLYVAYPQNSLVKLDIYDRDLEEFIAVSFLLNVTEPGIVSFPLPTDGVSLEVDEIYQWELSIYCDRDGDSPNDSVSGSIQRVRLPAELDTQLQEATPIERIALYAEEGIWFDALTNLAELRRQKPEDPDLAAAWQDLLTFIDPDRQMIPQPIVPCCQPE
jgi:hypothetical protein